MNQLQMDLQDSMTDCIAMHSQRKAGSAALDAWLDKWIMPLAGATMDSAGNVWIKVGKDSTTIFSCHTDTICLAKQGELELLLSGDGYLLANDAQGKATNLGADDTAGCYIMRQMVLAGVPGLYIFHDGEEIGCIGSKWIVKHHNLSDYRRIVAFDIDGTSNIVTHQMSMRCCSEEFAEALARALGQYNLDYKAFPYGSYTDSYHYVDMVAECTNISVGYAGEHTAKECVDLAHVRALTEACIGLDWEALPTKRNPGENEWGEDGWDETAWEIDRWGDDFVHQIEQCDSFLEVERLVERDTTGAAAALVTYLGLKFKPQNHPNYIPALDDD